MLVLGHIFLLSLLPDLPFTLTPLITVPVFPCQISSLLKAEAGRHFVLTSINSQSTETTRSRLRNNTWALGHCAQRDVQLCAQSDEEKN